jgi:ABC-type multidrug transport system ATPase subunit
VIELNQVSKRFGTRARPTHALRDVSVRIEPATITAFVGPNGAGKSTLFALILGFLRPTSGSVRIDGEHPRDYVRGSGATYVPDRITLPLDWRVHDTLIAFARLDGLGTRARAAASDALERFGLRDHASARIDTLSRGLMQRVQLAQALLTERAVVVLDEPAEGLDPLWRIRLRAELGALRARGAAVLLASHDLAEVERTADRTVLLDRGRVVEVLEPTPAGSAGTWRLELAAPSSAVTDLFPGAAIVVEGRPVYRVEAADAAELSARLAALLATGATLHAVQPETPHRLEDRVRRVLGPDDT